ncbi:MAG: heparinase [Cyclobacteriaceae bacterium]|nr:MAG: heparinase [Cyclobacteriaceae bacterium]
MKYLKFRFHFLWLALGCCLIQCSDERNNSLYANGPVDTTWANITSVEEVVQAYPDQMNKLLTALNLDYPGLELVKQAYQQQDITNACTALLSYYIKGNNAPHLRVQQPTQSSNTIQSAETTLSNVFIVQNVEGQVPYKEDGHRDWYYKGPNNDREWAWLSNRHSQINTVLSAYFETGNPKYPEYIDLFLKDFIIASWPYPGVKSSTSVWRGLEVAARAKVWSRIFYGLVNSDYLSPATRLLILSSLPDHGHYNRNFHGGNNWLTMEISALATVATNFPEFKQSENWLDYSIETMIESMKDQVYPDGVQTELTSHYHNVSLRNFELFKDICDQAGKPLPDFYNQTLEDMYSYIAHAVRPDGNRILNNDGDRGSDREIILTGARKFNNPEWEFIVTNGSSGAKPADGPSWFYPWAGHLISRSGYDRNAHWSFFDIGPWGSGHQHNDKLHLSISAYGRDLLVDAGRFAYTGEVAEKFRGYARSTRGHNTLLIDGKGQKPGERIADQELSSSHCKITPEFDYAWSSFQDYIDLDNVKHHRSLMYVRGQFWVVVDKVETDKPRNVETLWHWHPQSEVQKEGSIVTTNNQNGNLRILPLGNTHWDVIFIKGQEDPEIQGWYSEEYNKFEPNIASVYSTVINSTETFVWLLVPFNSEMPEINVDALSVNHSGINLKITKEGNGTWDLTIPYAESQAASMVLR